MNSSDNAPTPASSGLPPTASAGAPPPMGAGAPPVNAPPAGGGAPPVSAPPAGGETTQVPKVEVKSAGPQPVEDMHIDELLHIVVDRNASDLHLCTNSEPVIREDG